MCGTCYLSKDSSLAHPSINPSEVNKVLLVVGVELSGRDWSSIIMLALDVISY